MKDGDVAIVKTGIANTASVAAAVRRAERDPSVTRQREDVEEATHVILPGVGSFGAGMSMLEEHRLVEPLQNRVASDRPLLCICLGLQLLCSGSEESEGTDGLNVIDEQITRYPDSVRIPQFGWNRIEAKDDCRFLNSGFAYFANSYRLTTIPSGWTGATAEHGGTYVAALERSNLLACQFHLELSGKWGQAIVDRWFAETS